jgi:integrase
MAKSNKYVGTVKRGATWSFYLYVNGKKKWVGGFPTQRAAWEAKNAAEVAKKQGRYLDRSRTTLRTYVQESWLPSLNGRLKATTIDQYTQSIQYAINAIGDKPMQQIRPTDVERMQKDLLSKGLSPTTVGRASTILSICLKHARDVEELIQSNPCDRVRKPKKHTPLQKVMTAEQVKAVDVMSRGTQWSAFTRLAFYTGARRGELLALTWDDIDLDAATIKIHRNAVEIRGERVLQTTKSGKPRVVTIDPETVLILRAHKKDQNEQRLELGQYWQGSGLVTCKPDGAEPLPKSATQAWARLAQKAGVEGFTLHDCRHAHATHLLAVGVPLHVVAARLGHTDAMVTATVYSHVLNSQAVDASVQFVQAMEA